jgi:hypothetical protein
MSARINETSIPASRSPRLAKIPRFRIVSVALCRSGELSVAEGRDDVIPEAFKTRARKKKKSPIKATMLFCSINIQKLKIPRR